MTWLLKLYPPRWRRRYGQELKELVAAQPFSIAAVIDIIAGAIDAWIYPQLSTGHRATPDTKGEAAMVAKMMQLKCAGYGPKVTTADALKGAGVTLGGTVVTLLLVRSARQQFDANSYIESLLLMAFFVPVLLGLRHTSLKGRSGTVQAIFIVGMIVVLAAMFLIATWIGAQL